MIEYGVYGDLMIIYPQPYSIYLRWTIGFEGFGLKRLFFFFCALRV